MKLGKALQVVMARWNISQYRLAKSSGVRQASISAIILEKAKTSELDTIHRLSDGLEKLCPLAKGAFWYALQLPDELFASIESISAQQQPPMLQSQIERAASNPEVVAKVIEYLNDYNLIDTKALQDFDDKSSRFKPWPSMTREEYLILLCTAQRKDTEKGEQHEDQE